MHFHWPTSGHPSSSMLNRPRDVATASAVKSRVLLTSQKNWGILRSILLFATLGSALLCRLSCLRITRWCLRHDGRGVVGHSGVVGHGLHVEMREAVLD